MDGTDGAEVNEVVEDREAQSQVEFRFCGCARLGFLHFALISASRVDNMLLPEATNHSVIKTKIATFQRIYKAQVR